MMKLPRAKSESLSELPVLPEPSALREVFRAALSRQVHPLVRGWLPDERIQHSLALEVDEWLERLRSDELAALYAGYFPVPHTSVADYKNRLFEDARGRLLLAGIRFRHLELGRPFVAILWQERPFEALAELRQAAQALAAAYRHFSPESVSFYHSEHLPLRLDAGLGLLPGHLLLAAPVAEIAAARGVTLDPRVTLGAGNARALYATYVAEYDEIWAANPALYDVARPEDLENLELAEQAGTLFAVSIDGAPAGLLALERAELGALSGYQVIEIALYQGFRGHGFAPSIHVAACRQLAGASGELLFGTIGGVNPASWHTALRAGRRLLGSTWELPLRR